MCQHVLPGLKTGPHSSSGSEEVDDAKRERERERGRDNER